MLRTSTRHVPEHGAIKGHPPLGAQVTLRRRYANVTQTLRGLGGGPAKPKPVNGNQMLGRVQGHVDLLCNSIVVAGLVVAPAARRLPA